jgi:hypothetical protein
LTDQGELGPQPGFKVIQDRPALILPNGPPVLGAEATDFLLDGVETCDAFECLTGNRRRAGGSELIKGAADMRPAKGER